MIFKHSIILFIICFCVRQSIAQSVGCMDTSFVKLYHSPNTVLTNHQYYISNNDTSIISGRYISPTDTAIYITKLSPLANILWAKKFNIPTNNFIFSVNALIELDNGDILLNVLGASNDYLNHINIIKLNKEGDLIWYKSISINDTESFISDCRMYSFNNEIYISYMAEAKFTGYNYASAILKLDISGNLLWSKNYGKNYDCSSSVPIGMTKVNDSLIVWGRMFPYTCTNNYSNATTESSYYGMKVNALSGALGSSVVYRSPIELAKSGIVLIAGGVQNFGVSTTAINNNEFYLSIKDRYTMNRYKIRFDSSLNPYQGSFYYLTDIGQFNRGKMDIDMQGNTNVVFTNGTMTTNSNHFVAKFDINDNIIRQKYLPTPQNGVSFSASYNPFARKRNYLNLITSLNKNTGSYLQLYQLSNDEQNGDCYGQDTTFIKINPYPITKYKSSFFDGAFDLPVTVNDIPDISISPITIIEEEQCQQISNCSSLKIIPAKDTICSTTQKFIFSAQKNSTCYKHVFWQIDTSAVSEIIPINDTVVSIQFKKAWQGYLYASINSCSLLKDSIKLTVIESPNSISLGNDTTLCMGQSFLLNAKKGFKSYRWQDGSIDSMFLIKTNNFNVNTYYVTATDYCGNQFSDTVNVNFKTNPAINLGNDTSICINQSLLLDAGIGFNKYRWNTGELTQQLLVNKAGGYYVYAIDSINCFTVSSNIIISTKPAPSISLNKTGTLCLNQNNIIHAGTNYATYLWQDRSIDSNFIVTSPGLYKVTVSNTLNCFAADSVTITNIIIPPTHFLPIDTAICKEEPIIIHPTQSFSDYRWNNGSINNNISINQPGTYWLIAKDKNLCFATDTIKVIQKDCEDRFFIPTSFTPNNDGINDILKPTFTGRLISYHYVLYNRWGQKIFESNNATYGWDGRYIGTLQEQGIYTWYCIYQFKDKPIETKKGTCMLLH